MIEVGGFKLKKSCVPEKMFLIKKWGEANPGDRICRGPSVFIAPAYGRLSRSRPKGASFCKCNQLLEEVFRKIHPIKAKFDFYAPQAFSCALWRSAGVAPAGPHPFGKGWLTFEKFLDRFSSGLVSRQMAIFPYTCAMGWPTFPVADSVMEVDL